MQKLIFCVISLLVGLVLPCSAQETTTQTTVFQEFRPATVLLSDGRQLRLSLANVFLKNSSLLYKSGDSTKEAKLQNVASVDFGDRTYVRIDTLLAYGVDTVGSNVLYRADVIDREAFRQNQLNNSEITSLDLGEMFGYSSTEIGLAKDMTFPLVSIYFFRLDGKYVRVGERSLRRVLSKEKRRLMESVMTEEHFGWSREQSLSRLLKALSE